jgi:O-antigen ligase
LFLENSHLAYISSLIIFYYIFNSLKKGNINFLIFFLFFLISLIKNQSTTLLISNILISTFFLIFYSKNLDKFKVISFLCIFVLSTIFIFNPFHKEKVDDFVNIFHQEKQLLSPQEISNVKNLSSGVYFFNSKIAFNSLMDRPFGWGLYNYQFAHQKYSKITKSYIEGSSWLNNDDGANILFKSLVEMGIFSFLLYIPFLFFLFCKKVDFQYKLLVAPPIVTQVLIRGSGFFNGGFIVFLILYFYLLFKKN